ncbi:DNA repair protein RecN [Candidatus Liberibacter solanacearum]|uniref:DNA repair protein RecN n=1 Tax=Candidatus Liberibacter solanacearum TaxID=556287 RepID=A0A1V2N6W0_9HYPH|nr:DNA repair protein RecN [Candidatus Liberibacter solanacearum]ONI58441.1 DNA repair protein RecN [Candidatus Liberibacter solanacearum]ONI59016.1 DNA repair protein RecN [Candidatus Liberibacter solanacearum]
MLTHLSIRNIVIIENLDIDFSAGLSILSGETGSGKSIILDALFLAIGGRGDGGLVRRHTEKGQVIAVFHVSPVQELKNMFAEANITLEDNVILRRVQFPDGRTKAYVNDQLVSVNFMRAVGSLLIEVNSQHADRSLIDVSEHRKILDSYANLAEDLDNLGILYRNWRQASDALQEYKTKKKFSAQDIDFLRFSVEELQSLAVQPEEENQLAEMRSRIVKKERIAVELASIMEDFNQSSSPIAIVCSILRRLERKNTELPDLLTEAISFLNEAQANLSDAQHEIEKRFSEIQYDSQELENIEERLFALRAMSRKYSVSVDQIPELVKKMEKDLDDIHAGSEELCSFERALDESRQVYNHAAQNISEKRRHFAKILEKNIMEEITALKLDNVLFIVNITSDIQDISFHGIDRIEFYVRTNLGESPGPLMKLASGGELSRFLLALKIVLVDRGSVPTLVFDEVDSGVGGAVADAIGYRLKKLSKKNQLLVITHTPQVAARADVHFLVSKKKNLENMERTETTVLVLTPQERCEEIARMLAGSHVTEEARAAAVRLVELSQK